MKFNEKLIELRKREGLSQEELGYKLNVTRQTVSKWELGQTTPEMDKLVAMSKIFNISVDELINEPEVTSNQNTVIEDQPVGKENIKNNKKSIAIIAGVIIIVIVLIMRTSMTNKFFNVFDKATNNIEQGAEQSKNIFEKFFELINKILDKEIKNIDQSEDEKTDEFFNKANKIIDRVTDDSMFNDKVYTIINKTIERATEEYNY